MHVHRAARVLREAHGRTRERDTVLIDEVVEVGVGPREADQLPADHAFITAVDRIGKEAFDGHPQQRLEENVRRHPAEVPGFSFERSEIRVLIFGLEIGEATAIRLAQVLGDGAECISK